MKKTFWISLALILFLLVGCSTSASATASSSAHELQITDMKVSVGASEDNTDVQLVSYAVTLHNASAHEIVLAWITPLLQEEVATRALGQDLQVLVNKAIAPNASLEVSSSFAIDTSGLTKADMEGWRYIEVIRLSAEQTIPVPGANQP